MDEIAKLKAWVEESSYIVFFGGAGVSTESSIPDFRSTDGLYNQKYDYPPETILSHSFYLSRTEEFYLFHSAHQGVLPLLPGQDAVPGCKAEPSPSRACKA